MKCLACGWPIRYIGGENKEDYTCSNPDKRKNCPCWSEIGYYPFMYVRENWWFARQYLLPFKKDDKWYCIRGPELVFNKEFALTNKTFLQELQPTMKRNNRVWTFCEAKTILEIPYRALPVNEDFTEQVDILLDRLFNKLLLLKP